MLRVDERMPSVDLLQPPTRDDVLDHAVITTYSLDLEALLLLPMSLLRQRAEDPQVLLDDPLLLLDKLGDVTRRITVFCDAAALRAPLRARRLYGLLEESVYPTRAPRAAGMGSAEGGASFHAKLWVLRFVGRDDPKRVTIRVAVPSRNLTFDRCWDAMWVGEARPGVEKRDETAALAELVRALPEMAARSAAPGAVRTLPLERSERIATLADELEQCRFEAPRGFRNPVRFFVTGLGSPRRWLTKGVQGAGERALVVSPFVDAVALAGVRSFVRDGEREGALTLVSRDDQLDAVEDLGPWSTRVLADAAHREAEGERSDELDGLHAKILAIEGDSWTVWYIGSANVTDRAWSGRNVELMVRLTANDSQVHQRDIATFLEENNKQGFGALLVRYARSAASPEDLEERRAALAARRRRDAVVQDLLRADLAAVGVQEGGEWSLRVDGAFTPPPDIRIGLRPVTWSKEGMRAWEPGGLNFALKGAASLTVFFAVEIRTEDRPDDVSSLVLKLRAEGFPEDRPQHVLRSLIDGPEAFERFLWALLGGSDDPARPPGEGAGGSELGTSDEGGAGLLEDLLRTASAHPERLAVVGKLVADLRATEDGRKCLPKDFDAVWSVIEEVIDDRKR
jgi:hypothetical protein